MQSATAAVQPAVEPVPDPAEKPKQEFDVVIVDITNDGKTVQSTTSFNMTWTDKETGKIHTGTFTARRPTLGQLGQMAVLKVKLNGGENVDQRTNFLHEMISSLQVIIIDAPDWWTPNDFFTADPLSAVWDHVRSWLDSFRSRRVG